MARTFLMRCFLPHFSTDIQSSQHNPQPKGSQTCMGLASLFGSWMAQGLNPFHQCLALLTTKSSLGYLNFAQINNNG
jgi:hypothetical protein